VSPEYQGVKLLVPCDGRVLFISEYPQCYAKAGSAPWRDGWRFTIPKRETQVEPRVDMAAHVKTEFFIDLRTGDQYCFDTQIDDYELMMRR
jgi:hypothetical protein